MKEVIQTLLNGGIITGICIIVDYIFKYLVIVFIGRHPELSDDKVKHICHMVMKNTKILR